MRTSEIFRSTRFAVRNELRDQCLSLDCDGEILRLTRRAAMSVVLLLSLGLWAALWAAVASLASAVFG
jgi:hypothetical protein